MHRTVLLACLPCLVAAGVACGVLCLLVRLSRARFDWRRIFELHRCQEGGVQSLAFILTLPVFLCVAQFIVQVSQLMIGVMVVNYSAYAAARSAAVWIPSKVAWLGENKMEDFDVVNYGTPGMTLENKILLSNTEPRIQRNHPKYVPIFKAAVLAMMPAAPSRDMQLNVANQSQTTEALHNVYGAFIPKSQQNTRTNPRLDNKFAWSWNHTRVRVSFVDQNDNSLNGPTYNPNWTFITYVNGVPTPYNPYDPYEVGWQDPVTVSVTHDFALLPGPGRVLAKYLVRADGQPDLVSDQIQRKSSNTREQVYTIPIWASATATIEGLKSVVPYVQLQSQ